MRTANLDEKRNYGGRGSKLLADLAGRAAESRVNNGESGKGAEFLAGGDGGSCMIAFVAYLTYLHEDFFLFPFVFFLSSIFYILNKGKGLAQMRNDSII